MFWLANFTFILLVSHLITSYSDQTVTGWISDGGGDFEFGPLENGDLLTAFKEVNASYEKDHPPYRKKNVAVQHYLKRCVFQEPFKALGGYDSRAYKSSPNVPANVLIQSPCLGSDSLGNLLGHYFENIFCANHIGAHYMAVAKVWEPKALDLASPFIQALPEIVELRKRKRTHDNVVIDSTSRPNRQLSSEFRERVGTASSERRGRHGKREGETSASMCPCPGGCHERAASLWTKNTGSIKRIMQTALDHHLTAVHAEETIVRRGDLLSLGLQIGDKLPLVPSVAIHYRCGDNFIGPYGFLPFPALKQHIGAHFNASAATAAGRHPSTIYVLAENRSRKTSGRKLGLAQKCDKILLSLHQYLGEAYPHSKLLVRRGDDLYVDMARLTRAQVTICSVSTFCLWPAIANEHTSYFPRSDLVVGGKTDVKLGFEWIEQPRVVRGAKFANIGADKLIAILGGQ